MSLAEWYSAQWSRTRGRNNNNNNNTLVLPVSVPSPNVPTAMTTTHASGINHLLPQNDAQGNASVRDRKALEPLFGPNIGAVTSGPAWTATLDKKVVTDELTPDVVSGWVERSKDPMQPTTTLQALVNLKRPTIRLSPLAPADAANVDNHHNHFLQHALEFEYDADSPKVSIHIHVFLPKNHPDAPPGAPPHHPFAKLLVFESVYEGGFGRRLRLEEGAVIELGRFEKVPKTSSELGGSGIQVGGFKDEIEKSTFPTKEVSSSSSGPDTSGLPTLSSSGETQGGGRQKKRFTQAFKFRRHTGHANRQIAGPALTVVDAHAEEGNANNATPNDAPNIPSNGNGNTETGKAPIDDSDGVKITIRLVALDEQGAELEAPNEQVTYLHVVRVGPKPMIVANDDSATAAAAMSGLGITYDAIEGEGRREDIKEAKEDEEEDARPWVVKVVKREATIGPHTFHLHEIFGLTSFTAAPPPQPTLNANTSPHSYPPTFSPPNGNDATAGDSDETQTEECLLCLSSPREVVLLPCRHLVACKECALNMVEFGAGGNINQGTTETNAGPSNGVSPTTGPTGVDGSNTAGPNPTTEAANVPPPIVHPRRKRKAKGWFCPICRQPYTSLLRLTTLPPPTSPVGLPKAMGFGSISISNPNNNDTSNDNIDGSSGGILNALRPNFLRGLTTRTNVTSNAGSTTTNLGTVQPSVRALDVENAGGLGRVGA